MVVAAAAKETAVAMAVTGYSGLARWLPPCLQWGNGSGKGGGGE